MCRMLAASGGISGRMIAAPFLRMARGENSQNERNSHLGKVRHGDGWGAVLEEEGQSLSIRSALACWDDAGYSKLCAASVRMLHARRASLGTVTESNSHPFAATVHGEDWHFCHNGTLHDEPKDGTHRTDSERFFRRLVPLLEHGDPISAFESAAGRLQQITALNALLVSSNHLWAFCAWSDARCPIYYTLWWTQTPHGVVVSSEPLDDVAPDWTPMENGTALLASKGGEPRLAKLRLPFIPMPEAA